MKRNLIYLVSALVLSSFLLAGCAHNAASSSASDTFDASGTSSATSNETVNVDYQNSLFDTGIVHQIDVSLSDEDWDDLLKNPTDKTRYEANITIDGEEIEDVAFSTKGNSSLYFVADNPENVRFSFKVRFGEYVDGQTYHGLDKLNLNNNFCDATYLKDHLCFGLFRKAGVPAPLTSYVWLTVNGNNHGLYLAIEDIDEGFLNRNYGGEGVTYKPESEGLGLSAEAVKDIRENGLDMTTDPHGSDLTYTDDDPESYPDIFENAETEADETNASEVIAALKNLSEEKNLGDCLDTNEIINFFAVHNFVLNLDSYTGAMLHNIVLYENEGALAFLPWDYNLAFCGFTPGTGQSVLKNATDLVNQGIDTPLIGASLDDRPMWKWIVDDENYLSEYHGALDSLISGYFESGEFDEEIDGLTEMLLPYVEKDPTAFYSADEFKNGCEVLKQFCNRRAESIRKQLDGGLPTASEDQSDSDKVDASDISVMDMGAFVAGKE